MLFLQVCKENPSKNTQAESTESRQPILETTSNADQKSIDTSTTLYIYQDDIYFQQAEIEVLDSVKLKFKIETKSFENEETSYLEGIAEVLPNPLNNLETVDDENNNAIAVESYRCVQNDCWIDILMNEEVGILHCVVSQECSVLGGPSAPFGSIGLLRRLELD